jgi:hypothetical protein
VKGHFDDPDQAKEMQQEISQHPWSSAHLASFFVEIQPDKYQEASRKGGYGLSYNNNYGMDGREWTDFFSAKKDAKGNYLLFYGMLDTTNKNKPETFPILVYCTSHPGMADERTKEEIFRDEKVRLLALRPNFGPKDIKLWKSGLYHELFFKANEKSTDPEIEKIVKETLKHFEEREGFPKPPPKELEEEMQKVGKAYRNLQAFATKSPKSALDLLQSASRAFQAVWNAMGLLYDDNTIIRGLDVTDENTQGTRSDYLIAFGRLDNFRRQLKKEQKNPTLEPNLREDSVVLMNQMEEILKAGLFKEQYLFPQSNDPNAIAHKN